MATGWRVDRKHIVLKMGSQKRKNTEISRQFFRPNGQAAETSRVALEQISLQEASDGDMFRKIEKLWKVWSKMKF